MFSNSSLQPGNNLGLSVYFMLVRWSDFWDFDHGGIKITLVTKAQCVHLD